MNSRRSDEQFLDEIGAIVAGALSTGELTIDYCASELGISRRTLQRRFSEHSVNFSSLVDEVRRKLAAELLANEDLTISDIALQLGYSGASNFTRAFQRWTGMSPSMLRSRLSQDKQATMPAG